MLGQLVSFHKLVITSSKNITTMQKHTVMGAFNIPRSQSLGSHLGCPVLQGGPSKATFQDIIRKTIIVRLDIWKANSVSKAGKTILIQSHLKSLSDHTLQCFHLPRSVYL